MRGIFQLAVVPPADTLDEVQETLQGLPGVVDVVIRAADGTVFISYEPARIQDSALVATLNRLGCPVERMASIPKDLGDEEDAGDLMEFAAGFPGGPVAQSIRTAEIHGFDLAKEMEGEANQARFPGHST